MNWLDEIHKRVKDGSSTIEDTKKLLLFIDDLVNSFNGVELVITAYSDYQKINNNSRGDRQ
jgi:hypothetical protein